MANVVTIKDANGNNVDIAVTDLSLIGGQGLADKATVLSPRPACLGTGVAVTVGASAVFHGTGLTIPNLTSHMLISVEGGDVRFREDGSSPTATNGLLMTQNSLEELPVPATLTNLRFIASAGSPVLNISYRAYTS